jgi:hypothetical protein
MSNKDFRDLVARMRQAQKEYFKHRDTAVLHGCKLLEKQVDDELSSEVEPSLF